MCCRVFLCCCCFDLRRGVQVLGILFLISNIIGLVSNIISMNNTKTYYSTCLSSNAATITSMSASLSSLTSSSTSTVDVDSQGVICDGNVPVTIGTLKYWDKVNPFKPCFLLPLSVSAESAS